ncbi:hypothetical protein HZA96_06630 [Candidatus Woesearchaeota archaeon]|nr:hypothetical protein [Candidatus Woesearchaeota archaeon]
MFTTKTIDELLAQLESSELIYYDYTPAVSVVEALKHTPDDFRFWTNLPNKPLKDLYKFMLENNITFVYDFVAEMTANALRHGNKYSLQPAPNGDPLKSCSIKIFKGNNGLVFRVRNEGNGFNYQQMLDQFAEGKTHSANILGGNGTRILTHPMIIVSYEDNGRTTNLAYYHNKI